MGFGFLSGGGYLGGGGGALGGTVDKALSNATGGAPPAGVGGVGAALGGNTGNTGWGAALAKAAGTPGSGIGGASGWATSPLFHQFAALLPHLTTPADMGAQPDAQTPPELQQGPDLQQGPQLTKGPAMNGQRANGRGLNGTGGRARRVMRALQGRR